MFAPLISVLLMPFMSANASPWQGFESGEYFVIMRHAVATGISDPANFQLGDCSTQRNLSDEGRQQARNLGALLKLNGIETADVYSNQWCRCAETPKLLDLGDVTALPALNSFFETPARAANQTAELSAVLK